MLDKLKTIGLLEITLVQIIIYALLWLFNEYLASLLTFVMVPIAAGILIISLIADLIERSKVPRKYYLFMLSCVITPLITAAFFLWAYKGVLDWVQ